MDSGVTMAAIDDILAQFQLSDEDRKYAKSQALMMAGLGLLGGARKGREMEGLANAGMMGLQTYQQGLGDAQQGKLAQYKMRTMAQEQVDKDEARKAEAAFNAQLAPVFSGAPRLSNMGEGGPTPQNAAAVAPMSKVDQYRKASEMYAARGNVEAAKKYADIANSMEEEYSTTPQVVMGADGKPRMVQYGKRGGAKESEYAPKPDFAEVDLGGTKQFINKYNLPTTGQSFDKTMTPDGAASNAEAQKRLALEYAKFGYQKTRDSKTDADGIKPQPLQASERTQLQEFTGALENVRQLRQTFKPEYAGRGAMGNFDVSTSSTLGSWASKDAQDLANYWADYEKLVNLPERFAVFGASLTQGEKAAWDSARRIKPGADAKQVEAALKTMEAIAERRLNGLSESLVADKRQPAAIAAITKRSGDTPAKTVARTGVEKSTGRKVVQYTDGSTEYAP